MKLTGKRNVQADNAAAKEEKREAINKAGLPLADDEMKKVAGGMALRDCERCRYEYGCESCAGCRAYNRG